MREAFHELLKHALTPTFEPDFELNQKIFDQLQERKGMADNKRKKYSLAAAVIVAAICTGAITAYAAMTYLKPWETAEIVKDKKLAEAFLDTEAQLIYEKQSYGGYAVTLIGLVNGEDLSDYTRMHEGTVLEDRTYAVIAIEREDGSPMPDTSEALYSDLEFFASPLIGGYDPADLNAITMHGDYTDLTEDGILYRLVGCDNVEIFADHPLYMCVCDGMFYRKGPYEYDEETGLISRNEAYEGLNALFTLPVDASKADPEQALLYVQSLGIEQSVIVVDNKGAEISQTEQQNLQSEAEQASDFTPDYPEDQDGLDPEKVSDGIIQESIESPVAENPNSDPTGSNGAQTEACYDFDHGFWGGTYTDADGNLVVWLTEDTPENRRAVCSVKGYDESTTIFRTGLFTIGYLTDLQKSISDAMINKELPFVVSSAVRDDLNLIQVRVTTEKEEDIQKVLALDKTGCAIEIVYGSAYEVQE